MESRVVAALAAELGRFVDLGKRRLETLGMLVSGMISARTVNLTHVACERGSSGVAVASTYRRHQRFFQHVRLEPDWAAPMIAALMAGAEQRVLVMDRTNWKIGESEVNLLVLAVKTRHSQVPLMWTVLPHGGNSGAADRISLVERYLARFGKESIAMLLGDREFVGADWFNWLMGKDIPFTIRLPHNRLVTREDGCRPYLAGLVARPRKGRRASGTLEGMERPLTFAAVVPKTGEPVIVATNRQGHDALKTYRKRWAIESLFGNTKTRGLNFEDTRLTDPAKLALLTAIVALAVAWADRAARTLLGNDAPPRKTHGYRSKSYFRTGFDFIRHRLRAEPQNAIPEWLKLKSPPKIQ